MRKKILLLFIVLSTLSIHSCRTGCGCPMAEAETERGFQVAPKSSPITHEFIRGNKDVSSHRI